MIYDKREALLESMAQQWGVNSKIHPKDFIFQFVFNANASKNEEKAIEYYFSDGANSANNLHKLLTNICGFSTKPCQLLEFAAGYGCVTRHFKNIIPFCSVTACEIHPQAVQFIQDVLKTDAVLSKSIPENLCLEQKYDVVFALSFFSHMPIKTFFRWLKRLSSFVKPGGYLIFTTHGLTTFKNDLQSLSEGFLFVQDSEQKDIPTKEYGVTGTTPRFVFNGLLRIPNLILKYFHEGFWWGHQDVYICKIVQERINLHFRDIVFIKIRRFIKSALIFVLKSLIKIAKK